ncbi:DUF6284 family protein [Actinoplanes sp. NEAU-A12]|uniref:DUF6284 family protein n=1 Tax=Actinoplanes sandaracinus TaxID=3045177 RepID=A0ABT6WQ68_9ACTN|nr:DUF6284 family protein [Actinoplanes sandaracinus]MDI6101897.1 DUF6284 family protein [Actinoplanes sandaracinus]
MDPFEFVEPTAAELALIEVEQPLIDAELAWLEAEEACGAAIEVGTSGLLDWQRLRNRERAVIRETLGYVATRLRRSPVSLRAA